MPVVQEERRKLAQSEQENAWVETEFDRDEILTYVTQRKAFLEPMFRAHIQIQGDRDDAKVESNLLLPEEDMGRVLLYEERMQRQIDWSIQRLLENQERRRSRDPGNPMVAANAKRSQ